MRSISRYWFVLAAFIVVLGVTIWMKWRVVAQPVYHGQSLSHWIDHLPGAGNPTRGISWGNMNIPHTVDSDEAVKAIRTIGTNALPYITTELSATDNYHERLRATWDWTKRTWQKLISRGRTTIRPRGMMQKTSGEFRHWKAAVAIHALGTEAIPSIPQLTTMLNPTGNGENAVAAAYALSALGPDGLKPMTSILTKTNYALGYDWPKLCVVWALGVTPEAGRQALPELLSRLRDKKENVNVRIGAVWALGQLHTNEEVIVPALAAQLRDLRSETSVALEEYGFFGAELPKLKARLTNSIPYMRMAATNAVLALYPDEAAQLGIK